MKRIGIVMLAGCAMLLLAAAARADAPANYVVVPAEAFVPDVAIDAKGVVHMVYVTKDCDVFYCESRDKGSTFSRRVKVNGDAPAEFKMGERGPKLAIGKDGSIHVAWMDFFKAGIKTQPRYSRSIDGGKTFAAAKKLSSNSGIDGVTLTCDAKGNVAVFWHTAAPKQDDIPAATYLWMARSKDNGETFAHDERVKISNLGTLACSMCMMRARVAADGDVLLAYRSAEESIRDFYVLKGKITGDDFKATRVNEDKWDLPECPMCGPEMTLDAKGRPVVAFMSRNKVYWSVADAKVEKFSGHHGTPDLYKKDEEERYPSVAMNSKGEVLLVWQSGPMSIKGKATVRWATYKADGTPDGMSGGIGTTTSGTKAIVAVGADDEFYILTTAK